MRRTAFATLVGVVVLLAGGLLAGPASARAQPGGGGSGVPLPNSMAAVGDSITRAFDATSNGCFRAWTSPTSSTR